MNINYLKNSKDIEADNAIIQNLQVNGTVTGTFNLSPLNIQSSPPNSVTVDKFSKLIGVSGNIVDTTTSGQQIENTKIFNTGCLTNTSTGFLGVRNDTTPTNFLHTISYDSTTASIFACTSDTNATDTGLLVGAKFLNDKANATKEKFSFAYRSDNNTSKIQIEQKSFLEMDASGNLNNNFDLKNVNKIGIGTASPTSSITIQKDGNAEQEIISTNNKARLKLTGPETEVGFGPNFSINHDAVNAEDFLFRKNSTVTFMKYNSTSGCLGLGDNIGGSGLTYCLLNAGVSNKVIKNPLMTNAQESTFAGAITGTAYAGATFFNTQSNRLCFVDSNNNIHRVGGSIAASGNILSGDLIIESPNFPDKKGSIQIDDTQNDATYIVYMPKQGNVNLSNLEAVTSNVQTQLDGKVSTSLLSSTTLASSVINSSLKNFGVVSSLTMEGNIDLANNNLNNVTNINSIAVNTFARTNVSNTFSATQTFSSGVLNVNGSGSSKIRLTETGTPAVFDIISDSAGFKINNVQTSQDWLKINTSGFDIHDSLPFKRGGLKALSKNSLEEVVDPTVSNDSNAGYSGGSVWANTVKEKIFFYQGGSAGAAKWTDYGIQNFTFKEASTTDGTYGTVFSFLANPHAVQAFDIIINSGTTTMDVRVYNLSTASVLSELTNINTSGGPDIRTLTPPTVPYYFSNQNFTYQVQIKSNSSPNIVTLFAFKQR